MSHGCNGDVELKHMCIHTYGQRMYTHMEHTCVLDLHSPSCPCTVIVRVQDLCSIASRDLCVAT